MKVAARASNPNRSAHDDATSGSWRRRLVIVLIFVLAAPLSFLYVNQTSSLAAAGYDVTVLDGEEKLWQMRNEQLRLQVATLESLDRVDQVASSKLGMGPPQHQVFVNAPPTSLPPLPATASSATPTPMSGVLSAIQQLVGPR